MGWRPPCSSSSLLPGEKWRPSSQLPNSASQAWDCRLRAHEILFINTVDVHLPLGEARAASRLGPGLGGPLAVLAGKPQSREKTRANSSSAPSCSTHSGHLISKRENLASGWTRACTSGAGSSSKIPATPFKPYLHTSSPAFLARPTGTVSNSSPPFPQIHQTPRTQISSFHPASLLLSFPAQDKECGSPHSPCKVAGCHS